MNELASWKTEKWKSLKVKEKEKRIKKWVEFKRPLAQHQMHQHLHYRGLRRRREKGEENIFEEIIAENFPNMGKETDIQVQESQSPKQNQPKEDHTKTHCN